MSLMNTDTVEQFVRPNEHSKDEMNNCHTLVKSLVLRESHNADVKPIATLGMLIMPCQIQGKTD